MAGAAWYVGAIEERVCEEQFKLTGYSSDRRRDWRLLLRQAGAQQPGHSFDQTFVTDGGA